jgi:hypothetical protein
MYEPSSSVSKPPSLKMSSSQEKNASTNAPASQGVVPPKAEEKATKSQPLFTGSFVPTPGLETFDQIRSYMFPDTAPCINHTTGSCKEYVPVPGDICFRCIEVNIVPLRCQDANR